MPDTSTKPGGSTGKKAPNFYELAAGMPSTGATGGESKPATAAGKSGEKVQNVKVLLEVFAKMDKQEDDPEAKDMIRQMSDIANKYMQKLEGGGGAGAGAAAGAGAGGPGAESMPPGAAGAGAGGGAGASGGMGAGAV